MRTTLKILFYITLIGWVILHFVYPQITHTYIGKLYGDSIVKEKVLHKNSGSDVKYIFKYEDKVGNIRESNDIQCWSNNVTGFTTISGSWVEKQLLENKKVYIPGWHPAMVFEFIIAFILCIGFIAIFIFSIACGNDAEYSDCASCSCSVCIFSKADLKKDKPLFTKILTGIRTFFNT